MRILEHIQSDNRLDKCENTFSSIIFSCCSVLILCQLFFIDLVDQSIFLRIRVYLWVFTQVLCREILRPYFATLDVFSSRLNC